MDSRKTHPYINVSDQNSYKAFHFDYFSHPIYQSFFIKIDGDICAYLGVRSPNFKITDWVFGMRYHLVIFPDPKPKQMKR